MKSLNIWLAALFFLQMLSGYGQQVLDIQSDRPLYLSGEQMRVFIHHPGGKKHEVMHLELMNLQGEVVHRSSIRSEGLFAQASIDIPLSQESDWYLLRAYTIWMPSTAIKDLGYCVIPVYHAFDDKPANAQIEIPNSRPADSNIDIHLAKHRFQPKEQIDFTLSDAEAKGFAVSVIEKPLFELKRFFDSLIPEIEATGLSDQPVGNTHQTKLLYLGKIEKPKQSFLGALYVNEEKNSDWVSFSEDQAFGVEMAPFVGTKHGQLLGIEPLGNIQVLEPTMFQPSDVLPVPALSLPELPYSEEIKTYLDNGRKRRIIQDLYVPDTLVEAKAEEGLSFGKADRSYSTKEYVQFNTIEDFIKEVGGLIRLRKNKQGYNMKLFLDKNIIAPNPPLIFLNGFVVKDVNELMALDIKNLDRIDVFRLQATLIREFKTLGRNGVLAFYTKDPSIRLTSGHAVELDGFQKRAGEWMPLQADRQACFSPILYWNPGLISGGSEKLSFPATDDRGSYMILVWAMDENGIRLASQPIVLTSGS